MEVHRRTFSLEWWLVGEALTFREGTSLQGFRQGVVVLSRVGNRTYQNWRGINSSPLTTVSDDVRDLTPITPAHLALEGALYSSPDEVLTHEGTTRQRYLYQQKLLTHFWQRWRGHYLHQLSVRYKWVCEQPAMKIRDVLLISEDNVSRGK